MYGSSELDWSPHGTFLNPYSLHLFCTNDRARQKQLWPFTPNGPLAANYDKYLARMYDIHSDVHTECKMSQDSLFPLPNGKAMQPRDKLLRGICTTVKDESAPSKANKHPITTAT